MDKKFLKLIFILVYISTNVFCGFPSIQKTSSIDSLRPIATAIYRDAEDITRIHHDLNNLLVSIYANIELIAKKTEHADNDIAAACKRLLDLIARLRDDGIEIGGRFRDGKYADIGITVQSFKSASRKIVEILTAANISLLKKEFIKIKAQADSKLEARFLKEAEEFEYRLKGIRLILATETGIVIPDIEHLNIHEILEIALIVELNRYSNIKIEKDYRPQEETYLIGNEGEIFRVAVNILRNARESIPDTKGRISISTTIADGRICVKISDTGSGMEEETVAAFNAGRPIVSSKGLGRGYGLGTVRDLVHKNKGRISVASKIGQGTTFTINFAAIRQRPANMELTKTAERVKELFGDNAITDELDLNYDFQQMIEEFRRQQFLKDNEGGSQVVKWAPYRFSIIPMLTCTENCPFCLFSCSPERTERMKIEDIFKALETDDIYVSNPVVHLSGGEILLMQEDLIRLVRSLPVNSIITNCSTMTTLAKAEDFIIALKNAWVERLSASEENTLPEPKEGLDNYQKSWIEYAKEHSNLTRAFMSGEIFMSLGVSLDDIHLAQPNFSVKNIANILEAAYSHYRILKIRIFVFKDRWQKAYMQLQQELQRRGFIFSYIGRREFILRKEGTGWTKEIQVVENSLGRIGRAIYMPDSLFEMIDATELSKTTSVSFIPLLSNDATVNYKGDVAPNGIFVIGHGPLIFGNIVSETWQQILRRLDKDPLFRALIAQSEENINLLRIINIASEYDPSIVKGIEKGRPGGLSVFFYWLLSNPERKLYITYRLLNDCYKEGILKGKSPFEGMPNEALKELVKRQVADLRAQFRQNTTDTVFGSPSAAKITQQLEEDTGKKSREIAEIESLCDYQTYEQGEPSERAQREYGQYFPTPAIFAIPIVEYIKQLWPNSDICDLGAANGKFCFLAAREGVRSVTGIEARRETLIDNEYSAANNQKKLNHINGIGKIRFINGDFLDDTTDLSGYDILYFFYTLPKKYGKREDYNNVLRTKLLGPKGMKDGARLIVLGSEGVISDDIELSHESVKINERVTVSVYTRHITEQESTKRITSDAFRQEQKALAAISSGA